MRGFSLPANGLLLGLDIGGTKCAAVLGDCFGTIYGRVERPTQEGLSQWPEAGTVLFEMVETVCRSANARFSSVEAIGISCGSPLNSRTGTVLRPPNLPGWENAPVCSLLSNHFNGIAVVLENDANATAVAEHRWGAGKGAANLAYLTAGTGIGAGIILNGHLFRGSNDLAGEIGHAVVLPGGRLCLCGKRGCLEALASGGAIGRIGSEILGVAGTTAKDVINLAKSGNKSAQLIVDEAAYYLGIGIANLLQTLNLERVVVGSLAHYAGESYMDKVRQSVKENTWQAIFEKVEIVSSGLGEHTQDLAALAIALPVEYFDTDREQ